MERLRTVQGCVNVLRGNHTIASLSKQVSVAFAAIISEYVF